jgi:hypothetical protein
MREESKRAGLMKSNTALDVPPQVAATTLLVARPAFEPGVGGRNMTILSSTWLVADGPDLQVFFSMLSLPGELGWTPGKACIVCSEASSTSANRPHLHPDPSHWTVIIEKKADMLENMLSTEQCSDNY